MAENELELDEPVGGNRTLSVALGVLVVLSLLVLGYYYRRPVGGPLVDAAPPSPSARPSPAEVLPPPVDLGEIKVYVAGEVKKPGVVTLKPGARVEDAIQKAGGMTASGDPLAINLASRLKDEQMVVVPAKGASPSPVPTFSPEEGEAPQPQEEPEPTPGPQSQQPNWNQYLDSKPARVSLNHASQAELEAIPGVGPKTASDILAFRKTKEFKTVDDLLQVPGIGDKKLESIRPYVDL